MGDTGKGPTAFSSSEMSFIGAEASNFTLGGVGRASDFGQRAASGSGTKALLTNVGWCDSRTGSEAVSLKLTPSWRPTAVGCKRAASLSPRTSPSIGGGGGGISAAHGPRKPLEIDDSGRAEVLPLSTLAFQVPILLWSGTGALLIIREGGWGTEALSFGTEASFGIGASDSPIVWTLPSGVKQAA